MQEQEKQGGGRPVLRDEPIKRVTLELPASLWQYITSVSPNRTKWIVQALQEKREREAQESSHS